MNVREDIKAEADNLGFVLSGITSAVSPPHYDVYLSWIQKGWHGSMHYLSAEHSLNRRKNPEQILPGIRSILSLAYPYPSPIPGTQPGLDDSLGRVAAYAWETDYHDRLKSILEVLITRVKKIVGKPIRAKGYSDTGAILEKDFAERAGLGWIGKNTSLINPEIGSFFFLAEVLLDYDLDPDIPFSKEYCGRCQRCINACPTKCIQPDRTINASECIAYLTIEHHGTIRPDLRQKIGNWVFGCDVCQIVCPWNQHANQRNSFDSMVNPIFIPLLNDLSMTESQFSAQYDQSPIKRARRDGFLRNLIIAIGNSHDPKSIPALVQVLQTEPDPLLRGHAAWALGEIAIPAAKSRLEMVIKGESDPFVIQEITEALNRF
ncbi:MAG TPA: tRNA epoxyqueuosine(34) reductase QueG [Anaerolineaceae bacterium]